MSNSSEEDRQEVEGQADKPQPAFSPKQIAIGLVVIGAVAIIAVLMLRAPAGKGTPVPAETATEALAAATDTAQPTETPVSEETATKEVTEEATEPTEEATATPTRDPSATPAHLPPLEPLEVLPPATADDWSRGSEDAKVVWIEYLDFQ
jgi:cytoskeletal protein RodZ